VFYSKDGISWAVAAAFGDGHAADIRWDVSFSSSSDVLATVSTREVHLWELRGAVDNLQVHLRLEIPTQKQLSSADVVICTGLIISDLSLSIMSMCGGWLHTGGEGGMLDTSTASLPSGLESIWQMAVSWYRGWGCESMAAESGRGMVLTIPSSASGI
jgi:hypothetical protein